MKVGYYETNGQGAEFNIVRLIGRRLLVRKCLKPDILDRKTGKVLLYRTEQDKEMHLWFEILMVGEGCKYFSRADVGKRILCPERDRRHNRVGDDEWITHEDVIVNLDIGGYTVEI